MHIIQNGNCLITIGELQRAHFDISPWWCKYDSPKDLPNTGVDTNWNMNHLTESPGQPKTTGYFTVLHSGEIPEHRLTCQHANILMNGLTLDGYVFKIQGRVTCIHLFENKEDNLLTSSSIFWEDNLEVLNTLSEKYNRDLRNLHEIQYRPFRLSEEEQEPFQTFEIGLENDSKWIWI